MNVIALAGSRADQAGHMHGVAAAPTAHDVHDPRLPFDDAGQPSPLPAASHAPAHLHPETAKSPAPTAQTGLLRDATLICQAAATNGERISQRSLARQLRDHGHRFSNEHLHDIASTIGLITDKAA